MPNVNPVSDFYYTEVLRDVAVGEPVFPARKNQGGHPCIKDYEKEKALRWLRAELEKGRKSGEEEGFYSSEDVREHFRRRSNEQ